MKIKIKYKKGGDLVNNLIIESVNKINEISSNEIQTLEKTKIVDKKIIIFTSLKI